MNGYMILLCGIMDDMPVALVETKEDAEKFIAEYDPYPVDGGECETEGPLAEACKAMGRGPSCVLGFQVIKFINGRPVQCCSQKWNTLYDQWPTRNELASWDVHERDEFLTSLKFDPIG